MPRSRTKERPCQGCGRPVVKRMRTERAYLCIDCATLRIESATREMANKSGPAWLNWLASNADGADVASHETKE